MSQRPLRIVPARGEPPSGSGAISFDGFFESEVDKLLSRMWLVTRDRHEAEEVVQDAFLSLYERWDRLSEVDDLRAYLYRTAFNGWNKRYRKAVRAVRMTLLPKAEADDFEAVEARTVVDEALSHLSPRQRAALVLTELLDLSSEEAGEVLGIKSVTARVLASQARAAMRTHLEGMDG